MVSSGSVTRLATPEAAVDWLRACGARGLATDSRRLRAGEAFIAWPGAARDGRAYVDAARAAGAAACLVEAVGAEAWPLPADRVATLPGLKAAAGPIADLWYDHPTARLDVIAVTGTNGKTSTAWWTAQLLGALGRPAGLVGTLGIGMPPPLGGAEAEARLEPTGLTTPDPVMLQAAFRDMADAGRQACAIEASSIGLAEHRLAGTRIAVAQYTNLTRDHLDYHGDMAAYAAAKAALFDWPGLKAAVLNVDDPQGAAWAEALAARAAGPDLWTVALYRPARLRAEAIGYVEGGLRCTLVEDGERQALHTSLVGEYNLSNLLVVLGALRALGLPLEALVPACAGLRSVPGRLQRVAVEPSTPAGAPLPEVVVDYAHTPDALEKALAALRPFAAERGGRLWCVFGCGGNRDATKRPMMGAIAERLADRVVVTSDNPRDEPPGFILSQILAGVAGHDDVDVIEDRAEAIALAVQEAGPADVVLIAGKGHEDYQEIAGVKRPFSDAAQARQALVTRAAA